jgi:hypothetical protein
MTTIREIEEAIRCLSPSDLVSLRSWFAEFDAGVWDRQLEADVASGRLDKFADEALEDFRQGRSTPL